MLGEVAAQLGSRWRRRWEREKARAETRAESWEETPQAGHLREADEDRAKQVTAEAERDEAIIVRSPMR